MFSPMAPVIVSARRYLRLVFSPAVRAGRAVAAWVVRDISLIMQ